ncbi:hypothetical protein HYU22_04015 [Candidatus Woesearchaeota archaeon]|nr:hypothetical protein [Candidatus Woesearchaeota archaeon]
MPPKCPKCSSINVKIIDPDLMLIHCLKCGFNELEEDVVPVLRNTQREKEKHTPYKTGGARRIQHG